MHLKQQHPHLQVLLSIGGGQASEVFPIVAANTLLRDNFARSARGLVEASGLDGIDGKSFSAVLLSSGTRSKLIRKAVLLRRNPETTVAWEYPSDAQQGYDFTALLAAIRIHLPEDRYTLTAALPASKAVLQYIDFRVAAEYLDHLNLMAYDFFGPWSSRSGHHAQLYSMNREDTSGSSGVAHLMSHGFPARKILLGIPTHGRSFLQAAGPGHRFRGGGGEDGAFEYHQLPRPGCSESVDKRHVAAMCLGGDGGFVTYDNPETVKTKAGFCKQKGLAVSSSPEAHLYQDFVVVFPFFLLFGRSFLSL